MQVMSSGNLMEQQVVEASSNQAILTDILGIGNETLEARFNRLSTDKDWVASAMQLYRSGINKARNLNLEEAINITQGHLPSAKLLADFDKDRNSFAYKQLLLNFLILQDVIKIITYFSPEFSSVIQNICSNLVIANLTEANPMDTPAGHFTPSGVKYLSNEYDPLFCITFKNSIYIEANSVDKSAFWKGQNLKRTFDEDYAQGVIVMLEEFYHTICWEVAGFLPMKIEAIKPNSKTRTKGTSTLDVISGKKKIIQIDPESSFGYILLEGLASILEYLFVQQLVNDPTSSNYPHLIDAATESLQRRLHLLEEVRSSLYNKRSKERFQTKTLTGKYQTNYLFRYLLGTDFVLQLFNNGWTQDKIPLLLRCLNPLIKDKGLAAYPASEDNNSEYAKVVELVLKMRPDES